jgi:hypothetical protein
MWDHVMGRIIQYFAINCHVVACIQESNFKLSLY